MVADLDAAGVRKVAEQAGALASPEFVSFTGVDLVSVHSLAAAVGKTILEFGGLDFIVNTAAIYPLPGPDGELSEALWAKTFVVNVTGNYFLANFVHWVLEDHKLAASLVLTGSANAVAPKEGSGAYDTSKAALNHLIRELSIKLGLLVRVNGIAPATVVAGSTMFPRDRVIQSWENTKFAIRPQSPTKTSETSSRISMRSGHCSTSPLHPKPVLRLSCGSRVNGAQELPAMSFRSMEA